MRQTAEVRVFTKLIKRKTFMHPMELNDEMIKVIVRLCGDDPEKAAALWRKT